VLDVLLVVVYPSVDMGAQRIIFRSQNRSFGGALSPRPFLLSRYPVSSIRLEALLRQIPPPKGQLALVTTDVLSALLTKVSQSSSRFELPGE